MNKIIESLALISGAAEYHEKKSSAKWRITSALTGMLVWAANSYLRQREKLLIDGTDISISVDEQLYAAKPFDLEQFAKTKAVLATVRAWAKDCNNNAFLLDFSYQSVANALGLGKEPDFNAESKRIARNKCMQSRSTAKFVEHYKNALSSLEEQFKTRKERVEEIVNICSDSEIDGVSDTELYDDGAVDTQNDRLLETIGVAIESLWDVNDNALNASVISNTITRLQGYDQSLRAMMDIAGVNTSKLAQRKASLSRLLNEAEDKVDAEVNAMMVETDKAIAALSVPAPTPIPQPAPLKVVKAA